MKSTTFGTLSLFATVVIAESVVFESLHNVPAGFKKVAIPESTTVLPLKISLVQPRKDAFEQQVMDISTPGHELYGKHMSRMEIRSWLKPEEVGIASVLGWLQAENITELDHDNDWIHMNVSVGIAEKMLDTKFYVYENEYTGDVGIRTTGYSLPFELSEYINMVQPTTRFPSVTAQRSLWRDLNKADNAAGLATNASDSAFNVTACNTTITPACLKQIYQFGDFKADPANGNKFGIAGYLEEFAKYSDLNTFLKEYAPDATAGNFSFQSVNGGLNTQGFNQSQDDVEANLDVQYGVSLSYPVPVTYYVTGGRGPLIPDNDQPVLPGSNEPYLEFLAYMKTVPDHLLPQTISTSYGEDEQSVPANYSRVVCSEFAQLGARGVSILFSSGDTGVGSACQTNDGRNTTRFLPTFPAACPWVTSVGGTHFVEPEAAVSFSSGGFSDRFPRPSYQDEAVSKYLTELDGKWAGLYNPTGRGFPDVSAQGSQFHFIENGAESFVGGTSASAPTFAALISQINSAMISAHKPPLGFLNPWLYTIGKEGLTDITHGGSNGCTGLDQYSNVTTPFVPYASWNATKGWDPVTGLGTPKLQAMLKLALYGGGNGRGYIYSG